LKGIIVETEYEEEQVKKIICKKYNIKVLPKKIDIIINTTRQRYEE
jgi:histone acetyltransferase (RNA polymerase elongator complex component)